MRVTNLGAILPLLHNPLHHLPIKVEHTGTMGVERICIINIILLEATRRLSDSWSRKAKIPLRCVGDYIEAIRETQTDSRVLRMLRPC